MVLGWILGCVNFMNGDGEDWRVRCGWMYYACFLPVCGLFRSKTPRVYHVKKSVFFYDGRILGELGLLRQD